MISCAGRLLIELKDTSSLSRFCSRPMSAGISRIPARKSEIVTKPDRRKSEIGKLAKVLLPSWNVCKLSQANSSGTNGILLSLRVRVRSEELDDARNPQGNSAIELFDAEKVTSLALVAIWEGGISGSLSSLFTSSKRVVRAGEICKSELGIDVR